LISKQALLAFAYRELPGVNEENNSKSGWLAALGSREELLLIGRNNFRTGKITITFTRVRGMNASFTDKFDSAIILRPVVMGGYFIRGIIMIVVMF
jgi:hypothetical protein